MRYPKTREEVETLANDQPPSEPRDVPTSSPPPQPRTIGGIAIDPVPPTPFSGTTARTAVPIFRPPGAVQENQFLAGCTRCSDCADACPHDAIVKAPERLGALSGTPTINADTSACWMCDDYPCIAACEPGVLTDALPKVIGTAKITEHLCLAHHSMTCTVCSERCPVDDVIHIVNGKPTIDEDHCTGCGVCRYVCPAPENAILLMPLFNRPSLPS